MTTRAINKFSTDENHGNALEALMNYYGVTALNRISEEQALAFLSKLESGEINVK
jgi:hypothetical protein